VADKRIKDIFLEWLMSIGEDHQRNKDALVEEILKDTIAPEDFTLSLVRLEKDLEVNRMVEYLLPIFRALSYLEKRIDALEARLAQ